MKKKKKWPIVVIALLAVLIVMGVMVTGGLSEMASMEVGGVDLSEKPDGEYEGTFSFRRWTNTLTVSVSDHKITAIDIVDDVGAAFITGCSGEVFRRVIDKQSTDIDAVSGATVTTKAYLKAIEDALK